MDKERQKLHEKEEYKLQVAHVRHGIDTMLTCFPCKCFKRSQVSYTQRCRLSSVSAPAICDFLAAASRSVYVPGKREIAAAKGQGNDSGNAAFGMEPEYQAMEFQQGEFQQDAMMVSRYATHLAMISPAADSRIRLAGRSTKTKWNRGGTTVLAGGSQWVILRSCMTGCSTT